MGKQVVGKSEFAVIVQDYLLENEAWKKVIDEKKTTKILVENILDVVFQAMHDKVKTQEAVIRIPKIGILDYIHRDARTGTVNEKIKPGGGTYSVPAKNVMVLRRGYYEEVEK